MLKTLIASLSVCICLAFLSCNQKKERHILVFSKTQTFRHPSIPTGIKAIQKLGAKNNFLVTATEDSEAFNEKNLSQFSAIIFLNTTGDILNIRQQRAFERYIQAGGGYVGVHAASDTEFDWPWYGKLVGAYFKNHPAIQEANLTIRNNQHPSTKMFGAEMWKRTDEWYNFKQINPNINILVEIDETSYQGGENGEKHPIAWYHDYDGGRAFYTACGHTDESYEEPEFLQHLLGGIEYAIGTNNRDYTKSTSEAIPPDNRFIQTVFVENLEEPMELEILDDGRILIIERKGLLKIYDPATEIISIVTKMDVFDRLEDGLLGMALDPNFSENHWLYLYFAPPGNAHKNVIARYTFQDDILDKSSEEIIIEIPTQRDTCCHSGGCLEFGPDGALFLSLGDNTNPFESKGYAPIDERPGRKYFDAQRTSANSNDFRGGIIRIKPSENGSYTIPEGNLFDKDDSNSRAELYVKGCRNPFRISIDSETGYLFWGDVGPDAGEPEAGRGQKGLDEINIAKTAGFFGWPYFTGNNQAYNDVAFDDMSSQDTFDFNYPINDSPNNTGRKKLPAAQPALVWYSYDASEEFPDVKTGGKNPMAGPIFRKANFQTQNTFPDYFEGKLIAYEWMRSWLAVIEFDEDYGFKTFIPLFEHLDFSRPMDMKFGKDGALYMIEYGSAWFARNEDARLSKIEFVAGNRTPKATFKLDKSHGKLPFTVQADARESIDYDADELTFEWTVNQKIVPTDGPILVYTFTEEGNHQIQLTVKDPSGLNSKISKQVVAGNDPPRINVTIDGNQTFYFDGASTNYSIAVADTEDGSTEDGKINAKQVITSLDFLAEGFDKTMIEQGHQIAIKSSQFGVGKKLMDQSDCKTCHAIDRKINGPSYKEIAKKYSQESGVESLLASRIKNGSSGNWGTVAMAPHPQISDNDIEEMVRYILSLSPNADEGMSLTGTLDFDASDNDEGTYILSATYSDRGKGSIASVTERVVKMLRNSKLQCESADSLSEEMSPWSTQDRNVLGSIKNGSIIKYDQIDLSGISSINIEGVFNADYHYQGDVHLHLHSPKGKKIGTAKIESNFSNVSPKSFQMKLEKTEGLHDIYFVFKREDDPDKFVANLDYFEFRK